MFFPNKSKWQKGAPTAPVLKNHYPPRLFWRFIIRGIIIIREDYHYTGELSLYGTDQNKTNPFERLGFLCDVVICSNPLKPEGEQWCDRTVPRCAKCDLGGAPAPDVVFVRWMEGGERAGEAGEQAGNYSNQTVVSVPCTQVLL